MTAMSSVAASVSDTDLCDFACFSVHARAEPGVMPRVLELFAKRGLVPSFWHSAVCTTDHTRLTIEIRMGGLGRDLSEYITACLRQIASVEAVLTLGQDHDD
jgi:acetolactate synthase small subunit